MNRKSIFYGAHTREDSPCHSCTPETGRHPGCHGHCEREEAWQAGRRKIMKAREEYYKTHGNGDWR